MDMDLYFSVADNPSITTAIALKTVYLVQADASYDVRMRNSGTTNYIALRTYEGAGQISIEGIKDINALPGTLLFFELRSVRHYFCKGGKWNFWWFEFSSKEAIFPLNTLLKIDMSDNETHYCDSCLELLRKDNLYSNSVASAIMNLLIHQWIMNFNINTNTNIYQNSIDKVIDHMKTKLPDTVSIKEMSHMAGLSERRFRDIFKKMTGYQPKKYYNILRLKMAEQLLKNSAYSIFEISGKVGYSSQFHFSKTFKKTHGVSPAKYRQA